MVSIQKNYFLFVFIIFNLCLSQSIFTLTQRYFDTTDMYYDYSRGSYLIDLADASLESILKDENTGNFVHFKQTQGYNVKIITFAEIGGTAPVIMNAANEISVDAFCNGRIRFTQISEFVDRVLQALPVLIRRDLETVLEVDLNARRVTKELIMSASGAA